MVDTCVLLDIFTKDAKWYDWSSRQIERASTKDVLIINPIVYAEISVRFDSFEALEAEKALKVFEYRPIPERAAFMAGKCFALYKKRGGMKTRPLSDFFIGAHAAVEGIPLITRDTKLYRSYFPALQLIHP